MIKASTSIENEDLIGELADGRRTVKDLPHGGFLFLEHDVPFLLIYRKRENDHSTLRLARTGASYLIIGETHFEYFREFLGQLTQKMSARFGSFFLMELYSGAFGSNEFVIRGPSHKLPVSLEVLQKELDTIESRKYGVQLQSRIEQTKQRQQDSEESLMSISEIKECGGTLIGLEVPPIYRDVAGNVFPLYFRKFREGFAEAVQKSVFEFIRVQTSSDLASYYALGKREIHKEVFKMDRALTQIENSYQFLLLLAPVNIQRMREHFFESNFETLEEYHYRLLPVDPDILKRKLYNLDIDKIDDPALSYLFDEKREEIDQQLTMLKERGSKNFFYSSVRLYKGLEKHILTEAEMILQQLPEDVEETDAEIIDAVEFGAMATEEFEFFRNQDPNYKGKVHIRKDVNVMMVSNGELYLPADYTLTQNDAKALIQHEIGTHSLTHFNGSRQPLSQLSVGFADYDPLQEGIAVLSEYLIGGLSANRLRILAGRVVAGAALLDHADFRDVFNLLYTTHHFSKDRAFNITSRMFQGGGFLKDIIYLKGLVHLLDYIKNGGDLEFLLSGKFALKHVPMITDLTARELLQPPKLKPRYLQQKDFEKRMDKLKEGIPLSKMIAT
ncbi:flavohemoglobin expression-modulating QEGLA motif protein [Aequorivita echinoideorum]|uniref:DUF1704 domain-containing protein n=1 Tax=Aequorivita echinoideorum TaxID=1549647 RepID=A0ABS5S7U1_9FLAO|nr:tyrosine/phenylalanine carboxypeptidase domain-containing protein [Aequorivita echinoideorum]MBT0607945.1 DUF1704 domain-containing protein [Aequorivita echinoideorum]